MARQVRIEYEGAVYHVMCRGDRREDIFEDDEDRRCFLKTLSQVQGRTGWLIHAYVLMGNHYHLVVETPKANLVRGMTWFQTTYTVRYNARHRRSGHLYGGRYKAVLVDAEKRKGKREGEYFSTLIDYVHLNPVRAGLVDVDVEGNKAAGLPDMTEYPWTSLVAYGMAPKKRPQFLTTERGFSLFGLKDGIRGRRVFVERVAERALREEREVCGLAEIDGQGLQSTLRRGWCYGSEGYKEKMLELAEKLLVSRKAGKESGGNYRGKEMRDHGEKQAEAVIKAGLEAYGLEEADLAGMKKSAEPKMLMASIIKEMTTLKALWIAEQLSMGSVSNVPRSSREMEAKMVKHNPLRRQRKRIFARIPS